MEISEEVVAFEGLQGQSRLLFSTNCRSQVWLSCSHSSDGPLAGPQDFTEALKAHTLATNVPLNTSTRFILLWAVLLVAAPEKVAPLHECQTGPGIQEFAAGSVVEPPFWQPGFLHEFRLHGEPTTVRIREGLAALAS